MKKIKNILKKTSNIINLSTYFLPDVLIVLAVTSLFLDFGEHDLLITILLALSYIAVAFAEYYYARYSISTDAIDDIVKQINEQKFLTVADVSNLIEAFEKDIHCIEQYFKDTIEEYKEELKGELHGKVDSKNTKD